MAPFFKRTWISLQITLAFVDILASFAEFVHSCVSELLAGQVRPGEHDCEWSLLSSSSGMWRAAGLGGDPWLPQLWGRIWSLVCARECQAGNARL